MISAMGQFLRIEGNYTKDQFNYSRSYWFSFLPFYHMNPCVVPGDDQFTASYWLNNGLNQTEISTASNQALLLNFQPSPRVSVNELLHRRNSAGWTAYAEGRSRFIDGYLTWKASDRWTFAAEAVVPSRGPVSPTAMRAPGTLLITPNLASRYLNDRMRSSVARRRR